MISIDTESLLAYRYLKGIGKKYLNELATSAEETRSSVSSCFQAGKFGNGSFSEEEVGNAFEKASEQINTARTNGHSIISRLDPEYPDSLKAVPDAPPILFCSGNMELLSKEVITIIGTRSPTQHGISIAERITEWFTNSNWVIASGLAKGIDTISHESCLKANGETIAVLAHGLEKVYPAQNKGLAKKIVETGGLLVTEYGYNSYVGKANFVERDRIQAALAKAVVLVQSDLVGGSLHASRAILEYQRYLIVIGQSNRDILHKEEKISANMLLYHGTLADKQKLLKTAEVNLDRVLLLPDKTHLVAASNEIKSVDFKSKKQEIGNNIKLF